MKIVSSEKSSNAPVVTELKSGSLLKRCGLKKDDIITEVKPLKSLGGLISVIKTLRF